MIKKIAVSMLLAGMALAFTACSSIETATTFNDMKLAANDNDKVIAHMNAEVWGIYFFVLPLFTGNSSREGSCAVFSDTVRVENLVRLMTKKAKKDMGASKLLDLKTDRSSLLLPLFLSVKSVKASANVAE